MALSPFDYSSPRGQCVTMLLAVLYDLRVASRREAACLIARKNWFALQHQDYEPYPSQPAGNSEPRWQTLIAWSRKDSVIMDLISGEEWNEWGITRLGRDTFERLRVLCERGINPVSPCFLWSGEFKRFMCSRYTPNARDAKRPKFFYRDICPVPDKSIEVAQRILDNGTWSEFLIKYREVVGTDPGIWTPTRSHEYNLESLGRLVADYVYAKSLNSLMA